MTASLEKNLHTPGAWTVSASFGAGAVDALYRAESHGYLQCSHTGIIPQFQDTEICDSHQERKDLRVSCRQVDRALSIDISFSKRIG